MIHVSAFVVVGCSAAALAAEVEVAPPTLFLVLVAFCFFEFGFYVLVAILAQPLLGALAWWNVAIGNALAAFGMGWYLWRAPPPLAAELQRPPPRASPRRGQRRRAPPPIPPPRRPPRP